MEFYVPFLGKRQSFAMITFMLQNYRSFSRVTLYKWQSRAMT